MTILRICFVAVGLAIDVALAALPVLVWLRQGRDPYFTDDDSVLMPSPPPDFTPGLASVVLHGRPTRGTISAGLMELASRNLIAFRAEPFPVGHRAGIELTVHRPRRTHLPAPEAALYESIVERMGPSRHIDAIFLGVLSGAFTDFANALDELAVQRGWLRTRSGTVIRNWRILAGLEVGAGVLALGWLSWLLGGLSEIKGIDIAILGAGIAIAGVVTFIMSGVIPARTKEGAMLAAMLNAYSRTLEATIAQAQSLEQVVEMQPLPWVGTPTEEIAWAVAFNLDRQIDSLLSQSLEVSQAGGWPTGIRDWFSVI